MLLICAFIAITIFLAGIEITQAKIVVSPSSSMIEVDASTLKSIVTVFEDAEEAAKTHDLDRVMAVYSPLYNYHGLNKGDLRKVWNDVFEEYQDIASTHLFTKMTKVGLGRDAVLEVTCTGHLWAKSKISGLYVPIDSWHEEVHYLVFEAGTWRIRGNMGESQRVLPFGTAPHPLF